MIQSNGFHLGLSSDWLVTRASANIEAFLSISAADALGRPVTELMSDDAIHDIRNRMALLRSDETIEHLFHAALVGQGAPFDLSIYRDGEGFGIDAEPSDGHGFGDATGIVEGMLARIDETKDVESLCNEASRQLRALTGFDRAVIASGGKLLGQSTRGGLDEPSVASFPSGGDTLTVVDCAAQPVDILTLPKTGPDLTKSTLRLPTEREIAALDAIGARAALIIPLTRDGQPWGHVGCYHCAPRHLGAERRSIARLFARIIVLRIEIAELRSGR